MHLLLLSNSTNYGEPYLRHALPAILEFMEPAGKALFIPYAGVDFSWDDYTQKVNQALSKINTKVHGIHTLENPVNTLRDFAVIMVGGGNTFCLLANLYKYNLIEGIRKRVSAGMKYIGWSAGANVACPTIKTTNDMPVCEPPSFEALNLIPFQINPHYTDKIIPNHGGESRLQRLKEFVHANQGESVVCLPEGTHIAVDTDNSIYHGRKSGLVLKYEQEMALEPGMDVIKKLA